MKSKDEFWQAWTLEFDFGKYAKKTFTNERITHEAGATAKDVAQTVSDITEEAQVLCNMKRQREKRKVE